MMASIRDSTIPLFGSDILFKISGLMSAEKLIDAITDCAASYQNLLRFCKHFGENVLIQF
jgi:hypothetical protein